MYTGWVATRLRPAPAHADDRPSVARRSCPRRGRQGPAPNQIPRFMARATLIESGTPSTLILNLFQPWPCTCTRTIHCLRPICALKLGLLHSTSLKGVVDRQAAGRTDPHADRQTGALSAGHALHATLGGGQNQMDAAAAPRRHDSDVSPHYEEERERRKKNYLTNPINVVRNPIRAL